MIEHAVWLYHCFSLSLRDVETILSARGVVVSYESIRAWGLRFGRQFATTLKRRRPRPGDKWHLDEVFLRIRGKQHNLWRAIDQDGQALVSASFSSGVSMEAVTRNDVGSRSSCLLREVFDRPDDHSSS